MKHASPGEGRGWFRRGRGPAQSEPPTVDVHAVLSRVGVRAPAPGAAGTSQSVAYVVSKNDKKTLLLTLAVDDKGDFATTESIELDPAAKDAEGVIVGTVDGRRVVIIPCGRVPAQVLREKTDGKLEVVAKDSALRKGMLSGIGFSDIGFGDPDGDGKTELLVAAPGFIRALSFDDKGDLVVKDQFNTRRPGDKPRCPTVVRFKDEFIAYCGGTAEASVAINGKAYVAAPASAPSEVAGV